MPHSVASDQGLHYLLLMQQFLDESTGSKMELFKFQDLVVLRFYGPVNPIGSCRARSVYLTTRLLGRLSPLSG